MARDIFSRQVNFGGAFGPDGSKITFSGFRAGLAVQNVSYNYTQQIGRVYDLTADEVFVVAGRPQGQATISRVVGAKKLLPAFYAKFGDVCQMGDNHLLFSATTGCADATSDTQRLQFRNVVITAIQGNVRAEDMIINEQMQLMFLALDLR